MEKVFHFTHQESQTSMLKLASSIAKTATPIAIYFLFLQAVGLLSEEMVPFLAGAWYLLTIGILSYLYMAYINKSVNGK